MREIRTAIKIDAPTERVWQILMDFASYPQWNPFLCQITGEAQVGARLDVQIQPPGGRPLIIRPTVQRVEPQRDLRWMGRLGMPGIFTGVHRFELQSMGAGRTLFVHHESFTGLLVPIVLGLLGKKTRQGFEAMNQALKARAEKSG